MSISREELLKLYEGLRVTDVCDGMDAMGYQSIGNVDREIHALWRDDENFTHRIYGFALTVRFLPTNKQQIRLNLDDYTAAKSYWYGNYASDGEWTKHIQKGDIVMIDGSGTKDTGYIGSENGYSWLLKGAVGMVSSGGCRDTDEVIKQRMPVYSAYISRGIRPGRVEFDACQIPVNIGGVMVRPGDFVVADGDGVIVVPIEIAEEVAKYARFVQKHDQESRKKHYELAGRDFDFTLQ